MTDLRYPTGQFVPPDQPTSESRARAIDVIADTPEHLRRCARSDEASSIRPIEKAVDPSPW
jgi:hypothetical protein